MKIAVLSLAHERAETYVRVLRDLPGVEVIVADPGAPSDDPARGQAAAERLGVSYVDSFVEAIEAMPRAVVVTSEVDRRRELVELAAEAEAHVLCEAPLAVKEVDAKAIVDACDIGGVFLRVASPACSDDAFAAVRKGIADGGVGKLTTIHGSYTSKPPAGGDADGTALAATVVQLLDLVDAVLDGESPEQVYAQTNSVLSGQQSADSAAVISVRYPSGVVASIDCGWSHEPTGGPVVTFVGEQASVEYMAAPRLLGGVDASAGGERREPGGADLCAVMLEKFLAAIDTGEPVGPDGEQGMRAVRVVQAAYESAQTGQPVDLGR